MATNISQADEDVDINILLNTVGIDNFVLLENYRSIDAFADNLGIRFKNDNIYTYIGPILLSVNPFRKIPGMCSKKMMMKYKTTNLLELPPHIFALSQTAYVALMNQCPRQSVLISGESGAGKTECLKQILLYVSSTSHQTADLERIRKQLNSSVPILEAFGNAKTIRNDNSSRFGKYMELQFDAMGAIIGANVTNYLLEKSRTIAQGANERNYHIFYQLLKADKSILDKYHLSPDPEKYLAINQGKSAKVPSIDDDHDFKEVHEGLKVCDFSEEEIADLYGVVAAVLHLGEIEISQVGTGKSKIDNIETLKWVCECLKCSETDLANAIITKEVKTEKETVYKDLNKSESVFAKDSLAKAIFSRTFNWLVERTNDIMKANLKNYYGKIGLLDIYGFEIFQNNSFEQFCINYCNEKLHQLFVERTLKLEQEEYIREGIKWETIDFFNNKPILIFIEEKNGVITSLDEECILPGNRTDETFLQKLEDNFKAFDHFTTQKLTKDPKVRKALSRDQFQIIHYAGPVTYNIHNFLEKNKDLLYRNMKKVMTETKHSIMKHCFYEADLDTKKRPETEATQFKGSLQKLIDVLVQDDLHYIRCIKPNEQKAPKVFDETQIRNQIKYLGLLESLCVCRSGYAYRRPYDLFVKRYYPICPKTFPNFKQIEPKDGTLAILDGLELKKVEDYEMGKTKVFIRSAKSVMEIEEKLHAKKVMFITDIKALWKAHVQKLLYAKWKKYAIILQKYTRRWLAKRKRRKLRHGADVIRALIKGYLDYRDDKPGELAEHFRARSRKHFLKNLKSKLPLNLMDKKWPNCPVKLTEFSTSLKFMFYRNAAKKYIKALAPEDPRWQLLKNPSIKEEIEHNRMSNLMSSEMELMKAKRKSSLRKTLIKPEYMPMAVKDAWDAINTFALAQMYKNAGLPEMEQRFDYSERISNIRDDGLKSWVKVKVASSLNLPQVPEPCLKIRQIFTIKLKMDVDKEIIHDPCSMGDIRQIYTVKYRSKYPNGKYEKFLHTILRPELTKASESGASVMGKRGTLKQTDRGVGFKHIDREIQAITEDDREALVGTEKDRTYGGHQTWPSPINPLVVRESLRKIESPSKLVIGETSQQHPDVGKSDIHVTILEPTIQEEVSTDLKPAEEVLPLSEAIDKEPLGAATALPAPNPIPSDGHSVIAQPQITESKLAPSDIITTAPPDNPVETNIASDSIDPNIVSKDLANQPPHDVTTVLTAALDDVHKPFSDVQSKITDAQEANKKVLQEKPLETSDKNLKPDGEKGPELHKESHDNPNPEILSPPKDIVEVGLKKSGPIEDEPKSKTPSVPKIENVAIVTSVPLEHENPPQTTSTTIEKTDQVKEEAKPIVEALDPTKETDLKSLEKEETKAVVEEKIEPKVETINEATKPAKVERKKWGPVKTASETKVVKEKETEKKEEPKPGKKKWATVQDKKAPPASTVEKGTVNKSVVNKKIDKEAKDEKANIRNKEEMRQSPLHRLSVISPPYAKNEGENYKSPIPAGRIKAAPTKVLSSDPNDIRGPTPKTSKAKPSTPDKKKKLFRKAKPSLSKGEVSSDSSATPNAQKSTEAPSKKGRQSTKKTENDTTENVKDPTTSSSDEPKPEVKTKWKKSKEQLENEDMEMKTKKKLKDMRKCIEDDED